MAYEIESTAGVIMGVYEGATPAEALAAMHRDAGYDVRAEGDRVVFPDAETERICGGLDDWLVREVSTRTYRIEECA